MPSPTRGRWHGGAVTDEVEAVSSTRRCPPHQSAFRLTASPHRGSHWSALPKASPPRGGGSAKPRRRGRRKFAATSQSPSVTAPYPFCPFGTFPPDRGNRPLEGEPFSAAFSSASCRKPSRRAAGQKNRPPSPHICPQHAHVLHAAEQKTRNCAHCRRLRPRRRVFCVIFNVLSIKSLNFAGNNAKKFIF